MSSNGLDRRPRRARAEARRPGALAACLAACLALSSACAPRPIEQAESGFATLEPGLELGTFPCRGGTVHLLRIDLAHFELRLLNSSAPGQGRLLTARDWCERNSLVAAINASMFGEDYMTSISLMRTREHVNNPRITRQKAVLVFDPIHPHVAPARILDLECDDLDELRESYGTLIQGIRMLSCTGRNVWAPQSTKWSTAAIGTDAAGRVLFAHARSPVDPHELIDDLLALPLELTRMMYAEGGPQSQLFVRAGDEHEFVGGFDGGTGGLDDSALAWPIPNVVGVARKR